MNKEQIIAMLKQEATDKKEGGVKLHVETRDIVKTEEIMSAIKEGRKAGIENNSSITAQWIEYVNIAISANRINDTYEVSWY